MPRVLLADDSPHAQRMGLEILQQEGFDVLGVTDGRQVLESLAGFAPDLVLADIAMPDHSGYEICERIKANPALGHVKVVLLVGAMERVDHVRAEQVRADGVLRKPFESSAVRETIGPLLDAPRVPGPLHVDGPGDLEQAVQAALADEPVDPDEVCTAVRLALESAWPAFVDDVTQRVVGALRRRPR